VFAKSRAALRIGDAAWARRLLEGADADPASGAPRTTHRRWQKRFRRRRTAPIGRDRSYGRRIRPVAPSGAV